MCANWRGSKLTLTAQTLIWCLSMGKQHMLSHALHLFTWFFLQSYLFITTTPYHTKCAIWWSGWSAVKILWWKVGSTPRANRHVHPNCLLSSTGVINSSEQGLPLGAEFRSSPLGCLCSIHISKAPPIKASVDHLCKNCDNCCCSTYKNIIGKRKKGTLNKVSKQLSICQDQPTAIIIRGRIISGVISGIICEF